MSDNTRWEQSYENFQRALKSLEEALEKDEYSELERDGVIKRFEFTLAQGLKTIERFQKDKGYEGIIGPKDIAKQAFQDGIIIDSDGWKEMTDSRNITAHEYNKEKSIEVVEKIKEKYFPLLDDLDKKFAEEAGK